MASPLSLTELSEAAVAAEDLAFTSPYVPRLGGVDPLGLRQINFDLMDLVFPGLNNVAAHIRPFAVVAWAWRRAAICAQNLGQNTVSIHDLQDFVDRIEVVYAWSQFLRKTEADLPGREVLAGLVSGPGYTFGGEDWLRKCEIRKTSTALSAPINYGPGLKVLGWLKPHPEQKAVLVVQPLALDAIAAFEKQIEPYLAHPVFSKFGEVSVTSAEVGQWAPAWELESPTNAEQEAMIKTLGGEYASQQRRDGVGLVAAAVSCLGGVTEPAAVRRAMCGLPTGFAPGPLESAARAWRIVQVRQMFRLALEGLFYWTLLKLEGAPMSTQALVDAFLDSAGNSETVETWLSDVNDDSCGPVDWLERLEKSLSSLTCETDLPGSVRGALAASLREAPPTPGTERRDRLPLARAASEARDWRNEKPAAFLAHVFESWVIGQHAYWSAIRGMGDARARRRMILRLKIVLEEGGWTLTPGSMNHVPRATADRLETVLTLMREAGLIN
jgi:hypothetical protein